MKIKHMILITVFGISGMVHAASDILPRNQYLIMYKEASEHFKQNGIDIAPGIYSTQIQQTYNRYDLARISSGATWTVPNGKSLSVGYASGELVNTRNEVWAVLDGNYFLLKSQSGRNMRINKGVPKEIIPAVDGMFLLTKSGKVIYRNNDSSKNVNLMNQNPVKIFNADHTVYTLSADGQSLIYLSQDNKVVVHNSNGQKQSIVEFDTGRFGPIISISGDGLFLPNGSDKVDYLKLDHTGLVKSAKKTIFTKRGREKIVFYKNNTTLVQMKAVGGRSKFNISEDGTLIPISKKRKGRKRSLNAASQISLSKYMEKWTDKNRQVEFQKIVPRDLYIQKALELMKSKDNTWANIIGPFGSGKLDLLKSIANFIADQDEMNKSEWKGYQVYKLDLSTILKIQQEANALCPQGQCPPGVTNPMDEFRNNIKNKDLIIVMPDFLDDPLLGATNAPKAMDLFLNTFRGAIADGSVKIITTSNNKLYEKLLIKQESLKNMNDTLYLLQPDRMELAQILETQMREMSSQYKVVFDLGVTDVIIESSISLDSKDVEPLRSTKALKSLVRKFGSLNHVNVVTISTREAKKHFLANIFDSQKIENIDIAHLESFLEERIKGQDEALYKIVDDVSVLKSGIVNLDGPLSTLFFAGPTGVGKTVTAELLAEYLQIELLKVDMNYYDGFDAKSPLVKRIKTLKGRPFILLLDDVDKSPNGTGTLSELRGMIEKGIYAKGTVNELDVRNAIIIFTSNIGHSVITKNSDLDSMEIVDILGEYVLDEDTPEEEKVAPHVWSSIQETIVVFKALDDEALREVANLFVKKLSDDFKAKNNIEVVMGDKLIENFVELRSNRKMGARPIKNKINGTIRRMLNRHIEKYKRSDRNKPFALKELRRINKVFIEQASNGKILIINNTQQGFPNDLK